MTPFVPPLIAACSAVACVAMVRVLATPDRRHGASGGRRPAPDALARRLPGGTALASHISRSALPVGPDAFLAGTAGLGVASGLVLGLVARRAEVIPLGIVVAVIAARSVLAGADRRHLRRVGEAMPGVAQMLGGAVAAGLSLRQAIVRAARDTPEPLGAELRRASAEIALGARVDDALIGLSGRLPDPDLGLLVTAILVQRRTGGDLARALRDMASRLEERGRLVREIRGATAQARATAWMVAALPVLGAVLAESAAPGLVSRTASNPLGLAILVAAVTLEVVGVVLIRRIAAVRT